VVPVLVLKGVEVVSVLGLKVVEVVSVLGLKGVEVVTVLGLKVVEVVSVLGLKGVEVVSVLGLKGVEVVPVLVLMVVEEVSVLGDEKAVVVSASSVLVPAVSPSSVPSDVTKSSSINRTEKEMNCNLFGHFSFKQLQLYLLLL